MKKGIEQQLCDQLQQLDVEEVPESVWSGIQSKLPKPRKGGSIQLLWKVAAVLFLATSITLILRNNSLEHQIEELASLGDISPEYRELETTYNNEINQLTSSLPMDQIINEKEFSWMIEEMKSLEEINRHYRKDIGKSVDQERLVDALIDYYEKKLRLLKKLELEINRQQNEKEHTSTSRTI